MGLRPTNNNVTGTKIGRSDCVSCPLGLSFLSYFFLISTPLRVFVRWLLGPFETVPLLAVVHLDVVLQLAKRAFHRLDKTQTT